MDAIYLRRQTCCFTGHRPDKLPWKYNEKDPRCLALKCRIAGALDAAYDEGYRHFIAGMAMGADTYFCEAALHLRDRRPGVTVEAAIPCEDQASRWQERDRDRYFSNVEQCDFESIVSRHYSATCMQKRNRYMVDRSSLLIAAYDGMLGGTMYTINYAKKTGVRVAFLELSSD